MYTDIWGQIKRLHKWSGYYCLEWPRLWRITDLSLVVNKEGQENGHKNIFGLSVILELKVEHSKILSF